MDATGVVRTLGFEPRTFLLGFQGIPAGIEDVFTEVDKEQGKI